MSMDTPDPDDGEWVGPSVAAEAELILVRAAQQEEFIQRQQTALAFNMLNIKYMAGFLGVPMDPEVQGVVEYGDHVALLDRHIDGRVRTELEIVELLAHTKLDIDGAIIDGESEEYVETLKGTVLETTFQMMAVELVDSPWVDEDEYGVWVELQKATTGLPDWADEWFGDPEALVSAVESAAVVGRTMNVVEVEATEQRLAMIAAAREVLDEHDSEFEGNQRISSFIVNVAADAYLNPDDQEEYIGGLVTLVKLDAPHLPSEAIEELVEDALKRIRETGIVPTV